MLLSEFNLFEAMGIARQELRHSDFLAFLLAPSQSHGIGDSILKRLLHRAISTASVQLPISSIDVDIWSLADAEVAREWLNIDLLLVCQSNRLVIAIENKLDSIEHSNQLQRYKDIVASQYPGWKHVFLLLSRHGVVATHESFVSVSYADVAEALEIELAVRGRLDPSVRVAIEHYLRLLRRHVVDDSQIAELCRRIYQRHKQAIDLIVAHSRRTKDDIYAYLVKLIESDGRFALDDPTKTYLRFAFLRWDGPGFDEATTRGWVSSKRHMIFEFVVAPDHLKLWLIVGPGRDERRQVLIEAGRSGPAPFSANPTGTKNYTHLFVHNVLEPNDFETLSYDEMTTRINELWARFTENELPIVVETMSSAITTLAATATVHDPGGV